jgi:hypothetical protein
LLVAAAAMPVVAAARVDCMRDSPACRAAVGAGEVSTSHNIHDQVSMLLFLGVIVAPLAFARRFRQDDRWRDLRRISVAASAASFILAVAFVIDDNTANGGLAQRAFLIVPAAWTIVVSRRIVHLETQDVDNGGDQPDASLSGELAEQADGVGEPSVFDDLAVGKAKHVDAGYRHSPSGRWHAEK